MKVGGIFIGIFILCLILLFIMGSGRQTGSLQKAAVPLVVIKPTQGMSHAVQKSIFIPYWSANEGTGKGEYAYSYYFGVSPTAEGTLENEFGLKNISRVQSLPEKQKKLVLRLLNSSVTEVILLDKTVQKKLVGEVKKLLDSNAFSGIIIDLEVPFTLNKEKEGQITSLVQQMCTALKSDYKTCSVLIYGDSLYRGRPYDLQKLGETADTILLMAYDFHKPSGEPGPNFPFDRHMGSGEEMTDYGYDFKTLIKNVVALIPPDKIEVVFGMYGYDWTLNDQGLPLHAATTRTLADIQKKIENNQFKNMHQFQNAVSKEKNIIYVDEEGKKHSLWYEDEESVDVKTKYLLEERVWKVSFWAQSYF